MGKILRKIRRRATAAARSAATAAGQAAKAYAKKAIEKPKDAPRARRRKGGRGRTGAAARAENDMSLDEAQSNMRAYRAGYDGRRLGGGASAVQQDMYELGRQERDDHEAEGRARAAPARRPSAAAPPKRRRFQLGGPRRQTRGKGGKKKAATKKGRKKKAAPPKWAGKPTTLWSRSGATLLDSRGRTRHSAAQRKRSNPADLFWGNTPSKRRAATQRRGSAKSRGRNTRPRVW